MAVVPHRNKNRKSNTGALDASLRGLVATFGGYALSSVVAVALAKSLPLSAAEATVASSLVAIPVLVGAVLWAFAARTLLRALAGIAIPAALTLALVSLIAP
jgi:hypothetical protein